MGILAVGSVALFHNCNLDRKTIDIDLYVETLKDISTCLHMYNAKIIDIYIDSRFNNEVTIAKNDSNLILEISRPLSNNSTRLLLDLTDFSSNNFVYASNDILYTLKMSHRYLKNTVHFNKTRHHLKYLKALNCEIFDQIWLTLREKETYNYSHPNLKVDKSSFFNSNFDYIYDHDSIHESVKLGSRPAYTEYMLYNEQVSCCKSKFDNLDRKTKLLGVLEESLVLALERVQIPNDFNVDPKLSFMIALEKVCTSITSGWFRDFAYDNYDNVVILYDTISKSLTNSFYIDMFKNSLANNQILPYQKGNSLYE